MITAIALLARTNPEPQVKRRGAPAASFMLPPRSESTIVLFHSLLFSNHSPLPYFIAHFALISSHSACLLLLQRAATAGFSATTGASKVRFCIRPQ